MNKGKKPEDPFFKLGFRELDLDWIAYLMKAENGMDDPIELGRIRLGIVRSHVSVKNLFMQCMKKAVEQIVKEAQVNIVGWNEPTKAPKNEKLN